MLKRLLFSGFFLVQTFSIRIHAEKSTQVVVFYSEFEKHGCNMDASLMQHGCNMDATKRTGNTRLKSFEPVKMVSTKCLNHIGHKGFSPMVLVL